MSYSFSLFLFSLQWDAPSFFLSSTLHQLFNISLFLSFIQNISVSFLLSFFFPHLFVSFSALFLLLLPPSLSVFIPHLWFALFSVFTFFVSSLSFFLYLFRRTIFRLFGCTYVFNLLHYLRKLNAFYLSICLYFLFIELTYAALLDSWSLLGEYLTKINSFSWIEQLFFS